MTKQRLQAVAFDLWETLITDTPELSREHEIRRLKGIGDELRRHGGVVDDETILRAYRQMWSHCHTLYWSRDVDIPTSTQIEHFLESAGITPSPELIAAIEAIYVAPARELPPPLLEGALDTLRSLKARGLKLGLVSNTGRTPGSVLRDVLRHHGIFDLFDATVFSNEHGACKPQRSIFDALISALGVPSEATMFIGDNIYCDVHGAQSAGMTGVLFVPGRRGNAVAPDVAHGKVIVPDATIARLAELLPIVERFHD